MSRLRPLLAAWLGAAVPALAVVVGLVAAATPLRALFFDGAPYASVALVSLLAVAVALPATTRLPAAVALLIGIAAGVAVLMVSLADAPRLVGAPGDPGPVEVVRLVARGWDDVLAAPVPTEVSPNLVALPLAVCWAAAYLTVLLVRRVRLGMVSLLPLLAATVVLLLLGPGDLSIAAGAVIAAASLVHLAVRAAIAGIRGDEQPWARRPAGLRRFAARSFALVGMPAVVVAVVAGGGLGRVAAGDPLRTDLQRQAAISARDELTPLSQLRHLLLRETPTDLFTVTVTGAGADDEASLDRVRVATLERYDGALWTSNGVFLPVGRRVRHPDSSARTTVPISVEIRLTPEYDSSYLPVLGLLRTAQGESLALNEDTDTLITGLERGSPVGRIELTAELPVGERPAEVGESRPEAAGFDDLSGIELPAAFENFADEVAGDATDPVERLTLIEKAMKSQDRFGYAFDSAYSGHDLPVLATYLSPTPIPPFQLSRQGYGEQAAAAFTLLARAEGLPARVAVGYMLADPAAVASGAPVTVTTADAHAWTEVFLDGEWVVFDPTDRTIRDVPALETEQITNTSDSEEPSTPGAPPPRPAPPPEPESRPWRLVAVGAALVLLVLAPGTAKLVRSRLRRRGGPARRILGAWLELRDRLRDRGEPITRSSTPRDVAAAQRDPAPGHEHWRQAMDELAGLHDGALFAPVEPDESQAQRAWSLVPDLARHARRTPVWRRVLGWLNPRTLWGPPDGHVPTPPVVHGARDGEAERPPGSRHDGDGTGDGWDGDGDGGHGPDGQRQLVEQG